MKVTRFNAAQLLFLKHMDNHGQYMHPYTEQVQIFLEHGHYYISQTPGVLSVDETILNDLRSGYIQYLKKTNLKYPN